VFLLDGLLRDELGLTKRRAVDFCRVEGALCTHACA